jgi:hypothetical protein
MPHVKSAVAASFAALALAAAPAVAEPPDPRYDPCSQSPSANTCVNYTLDTADWTIELGRHVVDHWVWQQDGDPYACDTYEYIFERTCPPKNWIPGGA